MGIQSLDPQDEIARLLAVLIRRTASSQGEAVNELHRAGIPVVRIAKLLGTSPSTVDKDIRRAQEKKKQSTKVPKEQK